MSKRKSPELKLDLGCGQNPKDGFIGVDLHAPKALKVDLFKFPWPWKNGSVEEIFCNHFYEHTAGGTFSLATNIRWRFMEEVWRILRPCGCKGACASQKTPQGEVSIPCSEPGGKAMIIVPYWSSVRASQDASHAWPPLSERSFLYFNLLWRKQYTLDHYPITCDFDFTYGYAADPETASKSLETQMFYTKHYLESVLDVQVMLFRRGNANAK